jgi:hypothetical protein
MAAGTLKFWKVSRKAWESVRRRIKQQRVYILLGPEAYVPCERDPVRHPLASVVMRLSYASGRAWWP